MLGSVSAIAAALIWASNIESLSGSGISSGVLPFVNLRSCFAVSVCAPVVPASAGVGCVVVPTIFDADGAANDEGVPVMVLSKLVPTKLPLADGEAAGRVA